VTDRALFEPYRAELVPLGERMRGRLRIANGAVEILAGAPAPTRVMLIEFPSRASATLFYNSPEYEALEALRVQATDGDLWLIEGDEGR
jgi:uncharacterized protein (DUF1330 family)